MKTEMRIKTGGGAQAEQGPQRDYARKPRIKKDKLSVGIRSCACILLLALLAVCGYSGANPPSAKTTSAPVETRTILEGEPSDMAYDDIRAQHDNDRQRELDLLASVIADPNADQETKNSALAQKAQIAQRMETEAQVRAALLHMGYEDVAALCGAQQLTLIVPAGQIRSEEDSVRIVDAAMAVSGFDASAVKIILVKK